MKEVVELSAAKGDGVRDFRNCRRSALDTHRLASICGEEHFSGRNFTQSRSSALELASPRTSNIETRRIRPRRCRHSLKCVRKPNRGRSPAHGAWHSGRHQRPSAHRRPVCLPEIKSCASYAKLALADSTSEMPHSPHFSQPRFRCPSTIKCPPNESL